MGTPLTNGVERTTLADMEIGDYISYNYNVSATGVVGEFSNLGCATGNEIPVSGVAIPNVANGNKGYFIKTAKGMAISDRISQHSISWDALNAGRVIEGGLVDLTSVNVIPKMTSNTLPIGTVSASSEYDATTYGAWQAFNKSLDVNAWASANTTLPQWLAYDFGLPKKIVRYSIKSDMLCITNNSFPTAWTFDGWNGTSWVTLDTKTNQTFTSNGERKEFSIINTNMYNKYRINITAYSKGGYVYIGEVEMYETVKPNAQLIRSLSGGNSYADYTNKRIVSLLLHGEGADGSTVFTDSSPNPKVITRGGSAMIKTGEKKFGGSSMYFNGTTDYIDTPANSDFNFGADDFTVDFWIKRSRIGVMERVMGQVNNTGSSSSLSIWVCITVDNTFNIQGVVEGTQFGLSSTNKLTDTLDFHHVVLTRIGVNLFLYVDGVQWGTLAIGTGTINNSTNKLAIGRMGEYTTQYFQGYIDEFRIVKYKGSIKSTEYTSNFTPPTAPYSEPKNTFEGGAFSSTTDKGMGAYPEINEWDKYIVNSDLGGKIVKGDDNVWNYFATRTLCKETPIITLGANTLRTWRGTSSYATIGSATVTTTYGFRPVLNYLEADSKAKDLFS